MEKSAASINLQKNIHHDGIGPLELTTLRPNEEDFGKATAFYKALSPDSRMFFGPPNRFLNSNKEDIDFLLGKYPNYAFATPEGEIIGIFYLMQHGKEIEESPEFKNPAGLGIGITDQYQRKGLGSLGMDLLESLALQGGHDAIWLENFILNEKAAALYEKKGYKVVSEYFRRNLGFNDEIAKILEMDICTDRIRPFLDSGLAKVEGTMKAAKRVKAL